MRSIFSLEMGTPSWTSNNPKAVVTHKLLGESIRIPTVSGFVFLTNLRGKLHRALWTSAEERHLILHMCIGECSFQRFVRVTMG